MSELVIRLNERGADIPEGEKGDPFGYYLERGRMWWRTRPDRAIVATHLVIVDADDKVLAVGLIQGVTKDVSGESGRIAIDVAKHGERNSPWLGKTIRRSESRNPVAYEEEIVVLD